jgi:hypothetical protein
MEKAAAKASLPVTSLRNEAAHNISFWPLNSLELNPLT